ncbi:gamma-glutamyl-gamma-aminobutyrate hydrolase family protein [Agriterribacter sp.]|uniref:gamma-glutamyl-gamma-aminobutyrate hydrolase family protein n=1 Tax=Agriterribacter sp. TaxID=2821509 RepID=UPI002BAD6F50|nr:gamma-glutamyl-gamma-aminobutyrate hydrolase family protein [Agriterribacter sp.]HRO44831.1 gamma-glutamyl-gamma-aminobutyrate hydrolase family protein [Agriterribacter sp.]HRQ18590.1 gamma-glutamyl-gamma-aminobutyrate hydrolase family protein [Agriterribacter sp.]
MAEPKIVIGVTDCSKYANYSSWILAHGGNVEVQQLSADSNHLTEIKACDGIVLTGGEDVHPRFYNRPDLYEYCYKDDVSEKRDEFELSILEHTEANAVPVLGICRGLQIANVFFGGTLIPDIPRWGKFNHSKLPGDKDRYHAIQVDPDSWLHQIAGQKEGIINSNHHQSADGIGSGLIVSALSPDGIVEALERKNPDGASFLCLVQWHPERMNDQKSNFVKNIREAFVEAVISGRR